MKQKGSELRRNFVVLAEVYEWNRMSSYLWLRNKNRILCDIDNNQENNGPLVECNQINYACYAILGTQILSKFVSKPS